VTPVTFFDVFSAPNSIRTGDIKARSTFFSRLKQRQEAIRSRLCIGLDPDPARFPALLRQSRTPIFDFNRAIVDATQDVASCFKPQIAHFASAAAEDQLIQTIEYIQDLDIPVLLDAKRGDVGSTAEMYAAELFERYGADAATVNPYLGMDSLQPYLDYEDKGIFVLCRTSNPGGADLQHLVLENGQMLYEHVARLASESWNNNKNVGLVVGATRPEELERIREICGDMTFLLPGVGAQGADVGAMMAAGQGGGMLISSSRAILYASDGEDFAEAARQVAIDTRDEVNKFSN
jgi:orotidine-5'-phosphate decarboxylase